MNNLLETAYTKKSISKKPNYQAMMEQTIKTLSIEFTAKKPPRLLLHSCCAPCSTAVINRLAAWFKITVFYYNPNIDTAAEYHLRAAEQQRVIGIYNRLKCYRYNIDCIIKEYVHSEFLTMAQGLEGCIEGGKRCLKCYQQRLSATAKEAADKDYDFYCSTLSISPMKNATKINEIGQRLSSKKVKWLASDFKKKDGNLESIRLSKEVGLYRQEYCGCEYSKNGN